MEELVFESITKEYQDGRKKTLVIDDLSFSVKKGEVAAVIGPSGSGKSTFLSMAGALLSPTTGKLYISGQDITGLSQKEKTQLRLDSIGFIFQGSNLIPYLNTFKQLQIVRKLAKLPKEKDDFAKELLIELGLKDQLGFYPEKLSGGEKQRVAVARAFMNDPALILADEPTANVDGDLGRQVVEMIRDESHKRDKAAVIVTHDNRILDLMDKIYELKDGQLVEQEG